MTDESPMAPLTNGAASTAERFTLLWFVASVLASVAGAFASAALLIDYLGASPHFCDDQGGCGVLRASGLGWVGPVPLPAIGLAGNVLLALTLLLSGVRARAAHLVFAGMGAMVAALLIFTQFRMGVFCKYCMVVDVAMLVMVVLATLRSQHELDRPRSPVFAAIPVGAYFSAIAAPIAWGMFAPVIVPPTVAAELRNTPHEQVCLVDYVDYECPFCRQMHADMQPTLSAHPGKARIVRKNVPLSSKHPHAMVAARAACCAYDLDQGEPMASALMVAPLDQLTDDGCVAMAQKLGLDPQRFRACMSDPSIATRIDADIATFRREEVGHGLPTVWIDDHRISGAQGPEVFKATFEGALHDRGL